MNSKKVKSQNGKIWFIVAPIFIVLIGIRIFAYYIRTDGFSGISISIPLFLLGIFAFMISTSGLFAAWVYQDCKKRNDDGILWAIVVFMTTPFIGLLIYFLRRSEKKQVCISCGHLISLRAKYCEECGVLVSPKESIKEERKTHHMPLIVSGTICMIGTIVCLIGFIINVTVGDNINTSISSGEKVWNMGIIKMSFETKLNGKWNLTFKSASDGYVKETKMKIEDNNNQLLYADINCETIPEDATLILWLVQGDKSESIDVTNLKQPLEYSLNEYKNGTIHVRLQINGVEDVSSVIYIRN